MLGLTIGGAIVGSMGGFFFITGDQMRNGYGLMTTGAIFAVLGALAFTLGFAGMLWGFYQVKRGTMPKDGGTALRWLATLLIVIVAWAAVAHAVNHYRDGLALSLGIAAVPLAAFGIYRLWRKNAPASGSSASNDSSGPSSGTPSAPAPILVASKVSLVSGLVLFIAAAVFTAGSTQGVLLAIATTVFVLGGLGLLFGFGGGRSMRSTPDAPAAVTIRSLWLFVGGLITLGIGAWVYQGAVASAIVGKFGLLEQEFSVRVDHGSTARSVGMFLAGTGAIAAILGWCGLWYALSLMKRGLIPTTLRGLARTCAWLPVAFLLFVV